MRIHVVSDVHGNVEALARAGEGADALLVLGDLIDFVDYRDHTGGILGEIFGPEAVRRFAQLRAAGDPGRSREFVRELWARLDDPAAEVTAAIRAQYARLFAVLPAPTYATPGNVDDPALWPEFARRGVHVLDGDVAEFGGLRIGMVGGALLPPGAARGAGSSADGWRPYLRSREEYAGAVDALKGVDLLASHIPPAVPDLVYDVAARRPEIGSGELLRLIRSDNPRLAVFGHVHAPLSARARIGRTECVNAGHFQRTEVPYVVRW